MKYNHQTQPVIILKTNNKKPQPKTKLLLLLHEMKHPN